MKVTFALPVGGMAATHAEAVRHFGMLVRLVERHRIPIGGPLGLALLSLAAQNAHLIGVPRDRFLAMAARLYDDGLEGLKVDPLKGGPQ